MTPSRSTTQTGCATVVSAVASNDAPASVPPFASVVCGDMREPAPSLCPRATIGLSCRDDLVPTRRRSGRRSALAPIRCELVQLLGQPEDPMGQLEQFLVLLVLLLHGLPLLVG